MGCICKHKNFHRRVFRVLKPCFFNFSKYNNNKFEKYFNYILILPGDIPRLVHNLWFPGLISWAMPTTAFNFWRSKCCAGTVIVCRNRNRLVASNNFACLEPFWRYLHLIEKQTQVLSSSFISTAFFIRAKTKFSTPG